MLNNLFKKDGAIDENVAKQHRLFDMLLNVMNETVGDVVIFVLPSASRDYVYFKHEFEKYRTPAEGVRYNSFLTDRKPVEIVLKQMLKIRVWGVLFRRFLLVVVVMKLLTLFKKSVMMV